jgi:Flagellar capping protein
MSGVNLASNTSAYNVEYDQKTGRLKAPPTMGGVNPKKIIEEYGAALEAKLTLPQQALDKISERHKALSEIETATQAYHDKIKVLRGASPIPGKSGVFSYTVPSYTPIGANPGQNYLTVDAEPGIPATSFDVKVNRLAQMDMVKATNTVADLASADPAKRPNIIGTLSFPNATSPTATITFDGTETGNEVRNKINTFKTSTGVEAEWVPSGSGYKLAFKALNYATPVTFTKNITANPQLVPDSSGVTADSLKAEIEYRGEVSLQDSNAFKINNMSFQLLKADPDNAITVTLSPPLKIISDYIEEWATAHNDLVSTIKKYTQIEFDSLDIEGEDTEKVKVALLATNSLAIEMSNYFSTILSGSIPGLEGNTVKSAADLGITTKSDGSLQLDSLKLYDALQNHIPEIEALFGFKSTSTNAKLNIVNHPDIIPSELIGTASAPKAMTVTVAKSAAGVLTATLTHTGSATPVTILAENISEHAEYISIKGNKDSDYAGFTFHYLGTLANDEVQSSNFTMTQGFGDKIVQYTDQLLTYQSGDFDREDARMLESIERQEKRMENIQARNEGKLAQLEKKLTYALSVVAKIEAVTRQATAMESALAASAA